MTGRVPNPFAGLGAAWPKMSGGRPMLLALGGLLLVGTAVVMFALDRDAALPGKAVADNAPAARPAPTVSKNPQTTAGRAVAAARRVSAQAAAGAESQNAMVQSMSSSAATVNPSAVQAAPAPAKPAGNVTRAPQAPAAAPASAAVVKNGPVVASAAPAKPATPATTPSAPAAKPVAVTTTPSPTTHLDKTYAYQYNVLGRRDPFQSMVAGRFIGVDVGGNAPPDIGSLNVVGIVWGDVDHFALAEDYRGNSYVLRQGDKVMNGFVESIRRDAVVVQTMMDDEPQTVTLPLQRKGESNANR